LHFAANSQNIHKQNNLIAGTTMGRITRRRGAVVGAFGVLEGIPAIVLFGPLLFPIARQMGIHEVHYAMASAQ
jgi:TRAP-type C4-dicarboxylate transport system permease large subunit